MLNRIYQSTVKFLTTLSIPQTYKLMVEEAVGLVEAQHGALHVIKNNELKIVYSNAPRNARVKVRRRGYTWKAVQEGVPHVYSRQELIKIRGAKNVAEMSSLVIIPLRYKNYSLGALTLRSMRNKSFNMRRIEALKVFGTIGALALRKTMLNNELRTALAGRDMFISVAAHELKTPITIINGYLQLLAKERKQLRHPDWFDTLYRETKRLSGLINEFLVVQQQQLESWEMHMQKTSLSVLVKQTVDSFKVSNKSRRFIFSSFFAGEDDAVDIDSERIGECLNNVIGNAIKYSRTGSAIDIWVGRRGEFNYVSVADKGRGIPKEDMPKIFNKFYRGKTGTKGFGLGLYLVRNILKKHDAKISVKSAEGQGTTITMMFPRPNK